MKYNNLTLLEEISKTHWRMRCDCGREVVTWKHDVLRSKTKGCGCLRRNNSKGITNSRYIDGRTSLPEYAIWFDMLRRCGYKKKTKALKNYAGRGISVCLRWQSFENFYADMGDRPSPFHTIERRDNNGNYEPTNCIWATRLEQNNNRSNNRLISYEGELMTLAMWSRKLGVPYNILESRLNRYGWSTKRAFTQAPRISPSRTGVSS